MKEMKEVILGVLLIATIGLTGCAGVRDDTPRPAASSAPHAASAERRQQECIALAMYWEARGEGRRGMEAVGWTILNRTGSGHFPATPCEVVFEGGALFFHATSIDMPWKRPRVRTAQIGGHVFYR